MTDRLWAFLGGRRVGVFDRTGAETARFVYTDPLDLPLSLSLPVDGSYSESAAFTFLDNLLPDDDDTRTRLAYSVGTTPDTFSLLGALGEDVAGAVSLSPDERLPDREPVPLVEATEDDIAFRVATLKRDPAAPPPERMRPRWSLAGQQAKFSLVQIGSQWFWSTYEHPSTHIVKPAPARFPEADLAEKAALDLAAASGVPASVAEVLSFRGQRTFSVRRWDRRDGVRRHAEDLAQALGRPPWDKYTVSVADAVGLLAPYDQEWEFVRQLAFNVAVGNSDAHGKNYSVLLSPGGDVRLAPLYDCLPVFLWPWVDQRHAMDIGGQFVRDSTSEADWVELARRSGLDPARLLDTIRPVFAEVAGRLPEALRAAGLSAPAVDAAARHVRELPRLVGLRSF
jgi:serine/threonine-protein kinase HipA